VVVGGGGGGGGSSGIGVGKNVVLGIAQQSADIDPMKTAAQPKAHRGCKRHNYESKRKAKGTIRSEIGENEG
jgi:hypothetical protein